MARRPGEKWHLRRAGRGVLWAWGGLSTSREGLLAWRVSLVPGKHAELGASAPGSADRWRWMGGAWLALCAGTGSSLSAQLTASQAREQKYQEGGGAAPGLAGPSHLACSGLGLPSPVVSGPVPGLPHVSIFLGMHLNGFYLTC